MTKTLKRIRWAEPRSFRRYAEYQDSEAEWSAGRPSHWASSKVKYVARYINGHAFGPGDWKSDGLPIIRIQNLTDPEAPFNRFTGTLDFRYAVTHGDILISWSASLGLFVWDSNEDAWVNQHIFKVDPNETLVTRAFFVWLGQWFIRELQSDAHGSTMTHLTRDRFGSFAVFVPPKEEQHTIAAFLDRETAKIDALVAKKERLIELLQDKRTALITRAVTRGLDPKVSMKDSGVEWLGEIPAHWAVKPLKTISRLQTGLTLGKTHTGRSMTSRPYLRVANVQAGYLALDDVAEVELPVSDVERYELQFGDVLMTEGGDFDKLGRGCVWEGQISGCLHQNHIFAVRPESKALSPYFLALMMGSLYGRAYFTATSKQSTNLASTNSTKLGNFPIPVPAIDEQTVILRSVDRETFRLDALIEKVRQAIHHLKELRTALISAAVTGKIDVRDEAA